MNQSMALRMQPISSERRPRSSLASTRLFLIVNSNTPIAIKIPIPPHSVSFRLFKELTLLDEKCYKFYFKSRDPEFGSIKEEVQDDDCILPSEGDKIVAWALSNSLPVHKSDSELGSSRNFRKIPQITDLSQDIRSARYIKAHLHLDQFNFLGLTLIGSGSGSNSADGLFVAGIAEDSVVEQNGLIEIGDRLIDINGVSLVGLRDDNAISIVQKLVQKRGLLSIQVLRNHNPSLSRHSNGDGGASSVINSSINQLPYLNSQWRHSSQAVCSLDCRLTDLYTVYLALKRNAKSLGLKDYDWLRVTVSNAFLGSSLVKWLGCNVSGFRNKKEIKRYAQQLLKVNLIKSPVVNSNFSERCFYTLN